MPMISEAKESANTRLYRKRRAAGLCPLCGKKRDEAGKTTCSICREKRNARVRANREKKTPEEAFQDKVQHARNQRKYNYLRRLQGLCVVCGAVSPIHWFCEVCHDKYRAKKKEE
jgi:hypothetical protein